MVEHCQKSFIIRFIAKVQKIEPWICWKRIIVMYKVYQNHFKLLFASIKTVSIITQISASLHRYYKGFCLEIHYGIKNRKLHSVAKNRVPLQKNPVLYEINDKEILPYITQLSPQSPHKTSMLAYIAGYIAKKW